MTCLGSMDDAFCAQASIRMRSSPHSAACANASFLPGQFDEFMSSCGRLKLCDGFSLACGGRANARCRGLVSHIHGHSGLYVCLCRWGCRPPQASIALRPSLNRYEKIVNLLQARLGSAAPSILREPGGLGLSGYVAQAVYIHRLGRLADSMDPNSGLRPPYWWVRSVQATFRCFM